MYRSLKPKLGNSVEQMDIIDIKNDLIQLTGNRYRLVMKINSINFELKSEVEQDSIISSYENFLNSVDFPIQILVRTRALDIDEYLREIKSKEIKEQGNIYKTQLRDHADFVRKLVKNNRILSKNFYIIIPFDSTMRSDVNLVREQINVRADIIEKSLSRLSISCRILSSLEIIDLFYSFYSPVKSKIQPLSNKYLDLLNKSNLSI